MKTLAIIASSQSLTPHWMQVFRIIDQKSEYRVIIITWDHSLAEYARTIFPIHQVLKYSLGLWERGFIQAVKELLIELHITYILTFEDIPKRITNYVHSLTTIKHITWRDTVDTANDSHTYRLIAFPSPYPRITNDTQRVYIPKPCVDYHTFLDIDTQTTLGLKQTIGSNQTDFQSVRKRYFTLSLEAFPQDYYDMFSEINVEWYTLNHPKQTSIRNGDIKVTSLPIILKVFDYLILSKEYDSQYQAIIVSALVSGIIIIAPRTELYQTILSNAALYYDEKNIHQLRACLEIIQKSEVKGEELREHAITLFQKRYSYQSIADIWIHALAKI